MAATVPSAEIMISPELARSAMMQMQKDFEKSFKKIADDAQKQIDDAVSDGIEGGAKSGKRRLANMFKNVGGMAGRGGRAAMGGARAATGSIIALAMAGFFETIDQANQGGELIAGLLGENNAITQISTAKSAGMSTAEFAQFTRTMQKEGGFVEQQDINDIVFDINARVREAVNDGEGLLSNFTQYTGAERVNRVLASIATQESSQQTQTLDELGFSGETGQRLLAVLQSESKGGTLSGEKTYQRLTDMNKTEGQKLATQLEREATLANEFRQKQISFQEEQKRKLLDQIGEGELSTFFKERRRETNQNAQLLAAYQENAHAATEARKAINTGLNVLAQTTTGILAAVENITGSVDELKQSLFREIEDIKANLPSWLR